MNSYGRECAWGGERAEACADLLLSFGADEGVVVCCLIKYK